MLTTIRPCSLALACVGSLMLTAAGVADEIAARVTDRIQESAELKHLPIEIKSLGPTVWLSGVLADERQRQAAVEVAEATPGVERVVNQLTVAMPAAPKAAAIAAGFGTASRQSERPVGVPHAVKQPADVAPEQTVKPAREAEKDLAASVAAALRESGGLKGYRVSVKAKDGTVWLSGTISDRNQLQAAVSLAEKTPGVERVVNRLTIADAESSATAKAPSVLAIPDSVRTVFGLVPEATQEVRQAAAVGDEGAVVRAAGSAESGDAAGMIQLTQAQRPMARAQYGAPKGVSQGASRGHSSRPVASAAPRAPRGVVRTGYGDAMVLPSPSGVAEYGVVEGVGDGQMVPGSMQISDGGMPMAAGSMPMGSQAAAPGMGRPMPMGATGVGMPAVPVRGGGPNVPNYAWPSYAASPNYAAVQYPTQYSPTAWPYIGPFYPYPQVPLGWRRVSLEWDDGWWFLDFDERHVHSHHR